MSEREHEAMRAYLAAEVTRRFGPERAATLDRDIDLLVRDLAQVGATEVADETEPAFFLAEDGR
jgi:hypothetical protein